MTNQSWNRGDRRYQALAVFSPPFLFSTFLSPPHSTLPHSSTDLLSIFSPPLISAEQQWAQHICQQLSSVSSSSSSSSLLFFIFSSSCLSSQPPTPQLLKSIRFTGDNQEHTHTRGKKSRKRLISEIRKEWELNVKDGDSRGKPHTVFALYSISYRVSSFLLKSLT